MGSYLEKDVEVKYISMLVGMIEGKTNNSGERRKVQEAESWRKQEWVGSSAHMEAFALDTDRTSSSAPSAGMAENMSRDHAGGLVER